MFACWSTEDVEMSPYWFHKDLSDLSDWEGFKKQNSSSGLLRPPHVFGGHLNFFSSGNIPLSKGVKLTWKTFFLLHFDTWHIGVRSHLLQNRMRVITQPPVSVDGCKQSWCFQICSWAQPAAQNAKMWKWDFWKGYLHIWAAANRNFSFSDCDIQKKKCSFVNYVMILKAFKLFKVTIYGE